MKYRCSYCGAPISTCDLNCEYCEAGNEFYKPSPLLTMMTKGMASIAIGLMASKLVDKLIPGAKKRTKNETCTDH